MKVEDLLELGVEESVADKIMKMHKDAISGHYIPKAVFDDERNKAKDLQKLLDTANANASDAEALRAELNSAKEKAAQMQKEYEDKETHRQRLEAVKKELPNDIIDVEDVLSKLDIDNYKYADGKVKGLKEDIDTLRKTKPHYFKAVDNLEREEPDNSSNNYITGLYGLQKPKESSNAPQKQESSPSVELGKMLGQLKVQSLKEAREAREAYFK